MKYAVIVTPQAERDIRDAFEYIADRDAFEYIAERSPANANRWLNGLYGMIELGVDASPLRQSERGGLFP